MSTEDIQVDDDGELELSGGDFQIASIARSEAQDIIFRVRSETFGYSPDLDLPAGLDAVIGLPNKPSTGKQIEEKVKYALTRDGLYSPGDIKVDAIPLSKHIIGVYVFVNSRSGTTLSMISFTIDLNAGTISLITD